MTNYYYDLATDFYEFGWCVAAVWSVVSGEWVWNRFSLCQGPELPLCATLQV
jgi:hypothetical protein